MEWNILQAIVVKANFWQKITLATTGVVTIVGDAATGGGMQAALTTIGVFQLTTDLAFGLGQDYHQYQIAYPNG